MPKRLPPRIFVSIYSKVPRLCVEVILKTRDGIILTKRSIPPEQGKWHIPGGTVFKGESLTQAVRRVAKEELGIQVVVKKIIGVIEYPNVKNYFGQAVGIAFLVSTSAKTITAKAGAEEARAFKRLPKTLLIDQKKFLLRHFKDMR